MFELSKLVHREALEIHFFLTPGVGRLSVQLRKHKKALCLILGAGKKCCSGSLVWVNLNNSNESDLHSWWGTWFCMLYMRSPQRLMLLWRPLRPNLAMPQLSDSFKTIVILEIPYGLKVPCFNFNQEDPYPSSSGWILGGQVVPDALLEVSDGLKMPSINFEVSSLSGNPTVRPLHTISSDDVTNFQVK